MSLNNGDMLHATMHAGNQAFYTMVPPRMLCGIKHVTIVEIHMGILNVFVFIQRLLSQ